MTSLLAACGLDCAACDAYIATQANDRTALEKAVEKWRVEDNSPGITAVTILCDGCMVEGRKIGYCAECQIRLCAIERGLENCATCPDYWCKNLAGFLKNAPQAQANLEALRK